MADECDCLNAADIDGMLDELEAAHPGAFPRSVVVPEMTTELRALLGALSKGPSYHRLSFDGSPMGLLVDLGYVEFASLPHVDGDDKSGIPVVMNVTERGRKALAVSL